MRKLRTLSLVLSLIILSTGIVSAKVLENMDNHSVITAYETSTQESAAPQISQTDTIVKNYIEEQSPEALPSQAALTENEPKDSEQDQNNIQQAANSIDATVEQNRQDVVQTVPTNMASESKKEVSETPKNETVSAPQEPAVNAPVKIQADADVFDASNSSVGLLTVNYGTSSGKKIKLTIEKNGNKYIYDLIAKGASESFPLQMGSGEYKISILENTQGTSYKVIMSQTISVSLKDPMKVYLNSIQNVNWSSSMKAAVKAQELTKGLSNDDEKIKAIYDYVVSSISYDRDKLGKVSSDYVPSIDDTMSKKSGICYDYASLFAAMLRSVGIPAKLVKGYTSNAEGYHAWNEVYMKSTGNWVVIDTTYDSQMNASNYKFEMMKDSKVYNKSKEY